MKRSYKNALRCMWDGTAVTETGLCLHLRVYHLNSVPAAALDDPSQARQFFQTREEYKEAQKKKKKESRKLKPLDTEALYSKMVHYYIDVKGYPKDRANKLAKIIVEQQVEKRKQKQPSWGTLA